MEASGQLHAATVLRPGKKGPSAGRNVFEEEENLNFSEFESRTVKLLASRCTDVVTPAAVYIWNKIGCRSSVSSDGNRQPDKDVPNSLA